MNKLPFVPVVFLGVFLFVSNLYAARLLPPDPASLSLDSMSAVGSVVLSANLGGDAVAPVLVREINRVRVGIKKESGHFSDYSYMFVTKVEPVAGLDPAPVTAAEGTTKYGGLGAVKLKTVLSTLGRVEISLTIRDPGGAVVGNWSGSTNVIPQEAVPTTTKVD